MTKTTDTTELRADLAVSLLLAIIPVDPRLAIELARDMPAYTDLVKAVANWNLAELDALPTHPVIQIEIEETRQWLASQ